MVKNKQFKNFKASSLLWCLPGLLLAQTAPAITCPAGTQVDRLVWENQWTPANDLTFTSQTFTSESGDVDVRVRVNTTGGAGCDNSQITTLARDTYYSAFLPTDTLSIGVDWPNQDCQVRLRLTTFLDGTNTQIDVSRMEVTFYDADVGGGSAPFNWVDVLRYNPAPTNRFNGAGSSFIETVNTTEADINNCRNTSVADYERCRQTASWDGPLSRINAFYQSGASALANPAFQRIFIGDIEFCTPNTLPVGLTKFSAMRTSFNQISFNWETASELANAGFMLWGQVHDRWVALSPSLIPSKQSTGHKQQSYKSRVRLSDDLQGVSSVAISSVDIGGEEEFFGPFALGDEYGENTIPEPIEWSKYAASYESRMRELGYKFINNRWQKPRLRHQRLAKNGKGKTPTESVFVTVDAPGFYRVTGQDLINVGWKLADIDPLDIAVTHKGRSVARDLISPQGPLAKNQKRISAQDALVFYAKGLAPEDSIYVAKPVYEIRLNREYVQPMPIVGQRPSMRSHTGGLAHDRHTYTIEQDNIHNVAAQAGNPWMMHQFFTLYGETDKNYYFDLPDVLQGDSANLKLALHAVSDFPAVTDPDTGNVIDEHRVVVKVNGTVIADETTNDAVAWPLDIEFDAALLTAGANEVTVIVPGVEEYWFDIVVLDSLSLTVTQSTLESPDYTQFTAFSASPGHLVHNRFSTKKGLFAYAVNDKGNAVKPRSRFRTLLRNNDGVREPAILIGNVDLANAEQMTYRVGTSASIPRPEDMWLKPNTSLDIDWRADYVIIVEDSLREALEQFVEHREQSGYNVAVYSYSQIVDEFGFGYRTPDAIKNFLYQLSTNTPISHVLLVGGHTYDYLNRSNAAVAPVNFIPAFYRSSSDLIHATPTDLPFVDFNDDGAPELAIGRWPVRDADELSTIIRKTIAFDTASEDGTFGRGSAQKALLVAEREDNGMYKNINAAFAQRIGAQAHDGTVVQPWTQIGFVNVDDYDATAGDANAQARADIIEYLNAGQKLTMFTGHGSAIRWSKQNLFTTESISALQNANTPTAIITLACYTTYYESLETNTLAHQFMFSEGGAALLIGAPMLGETLEIRSIITDILDQSMQGNTVGEAVRAALAQSIAGGDTFKTTSNWSLLGDPALRLNH